MNSIVNIYCDESCHLENDGQKIMGFGAVVCSDVRLKEVNAEMADLKEKHRARGELKWGKVSASRLPFYLELIDWFFAEPGLQFRGWIVEHKSRLAHDFFNAGSHDSFYYKMLYYLLDPLILWRSPSAKPRSYRIYLDVKDTRSRKKVAFLRDVLRTKKRDKDGTLIERVQSTPAEEIQLMQLADFLLGALCYRNRAEVIRSEAKLTCVEKIQGHIGRNLVGATAPWERKYNFFTFTPKEAKA